MILLSLRKCRIGVVGLGYVGLPLAVEFGKHFATVGFDVKAGRIAALKRGVDTTWKPPRPSSRAQRSSPSQQTLPSLNAAAYSSSRFQLPSMPTNGPI